MPNQLVVARVGEIAPGGMKKFSGAGYTLLVLNGDDGYYVTDDTCTHAEASLSEGTLDGCEIECPVHGAKFDLKTGEVLSLPAFVPLRTYPVSIAGDEVRVDVS